MPVTYVYFEPVMLAGITPDEVAYEPKHLLGAGNHTFRRRVPLTHAAYVGKTVNRGSRVRPTLGGAQMDELVLEHLRLPLHYRHQLMRVFDGVVRRGRIIWVLHTVNAFLLTLLTTALWGGGSVVSRYHPVSPPAHGLHRH